MNHTVLRPIETDEPDYRFLKVTAAYGRVLSCLLALAVLIAFFLWGQPIGAGLVIVATGAAIVTLWLGLLLTDFARLMVDTLVPK